MIIKIADIEHEKDKKLELSFETQLDEIETKNPIKVNVLLESLGDFIKLSGNAKGVAILCCDLCLNKYEYSFDIEINELFAKNSLHETYGKETELKEGQFVTDLENADEIDISDVLYQSVILDFPNKKVCDINCKGGDIFIRDEEPPEKEIDPRMGIFKDIKIERKD